MSRLFGRWAQSAAVAAVTAVAVVAVGCERRSDAAAASNAPEAHHEAAASTVVVDQQALADIKLAMVEEQELSRTLTVAGKVQFEDDRFAHVVAPLSGQVVDLRVKVGDVVAKGQVLCTLASRDATTAMGEHVESHKDLELAEKTAAMTEDLFAHQAASRIALQQAQNDLAKARARVARAEEALRVLGLGEVDELTGRVPLVSPIAGSVLERRVVNGEFVQGDGMSIITIGNLSEVWVVGDVFENDLRQVSLGERAAVSAAAYPGETFEGRVSYISDTLDPTTRTAKVRVSVANPHGRLKGEMFATVRLTVSNGQRALVVPSRAVFAEDGRTFVYTRVASGGFVRRPVNVGPDDGPNRQVLDGLESGEAVVVDGVLLLRQEEDRRVG